MTELVGRDSQLLVVRRWTQLADGAGDLGDDTALGQGGDRVGVEVAVVLALFGGRLDDDAVSGVFLSGRDETCADGVQPRPNFILRDFQCLRLA